MFDREPVPDADHGTLERGVEALGGVGVGDGCRILVPADVFARRVVDVQVSRELAPDPAIGRKLVGAENGLADIEVVQDEGGDGALGMGLALGGAGTASAFDGDCHHALAGAGSPGGLIVVRVALGGLAPLALLAAEVCFVHLYDAAQQPVLVLHHAADALAEEPCGFLADAEVFAQLDRRDALAGSGHQIEGGEPRPQWQMGSFQRGAMRYLEFGQAGIAPEVVSTSGMVGAVDAPAMRANRPARPAQSFEMRPTGIIIGEPLEEGQQRHAGENAPSGHESQ